MHYFDSIFKNIFCHMEYSEKSSEVYLLEDGKSNLCHTTID